VGINSGRDIGDLSGMCLLAGHWEMLSNRYAKTQPT